jgi:hypothetical protein
MTEYQPFSADELIAHNQIIQGLKEDEPKETPSVEDRVDVSIGDVTEIIHIPIEGEPYVRRTINHV